MSPSLRRSGLRAGRAGGARVPPAGAEPVLGGQRRLLAPVPGGAAPPPREELHVRLPHALHPQARRQDMRW